MSRTNSMAGGLLLCGLLFSTSAPAQNLASNPGFETGDTSGWAAFGGCTISTENTVAHSGSYAGLVTGRTQPWNGISQQFQGIMQAGQTYNISCWLELDGGTNQEMSLTIEQNDGGGTTYPLHIYGTVSNGSWAQLAGTSTVVGNGSISSLVLYAEMPNNATNSYYIDDLSVTPTNGPVVTWDCTVEWGSLMQRIDGFGASGAWGSGWTEAQADMFFSTNNGAGLSFLRTRIAPDGTTDEADLMLMAVARGARVWSTPWSPPAAFKDNDSVNSGDFLSQYNQAYADQLANYVLNIKTNLGIPIYAISLQNEPQEATDYESALWTAQQFHDFIPYVYNALASQGVGDTKILFAESATWGASEGFTDTAMSDATVSNMVGIIGSHDYDLACSPLNNGAKPLWETEVSTFDAFDGGISNGVYWAGQVFDFLTIANVNAWHYWWLVDFNDTGDNEGLCDQYGNPAKRLYTLGNYSRFARPGYYRVGVSNNSPALVTAFRDARSGRFALVAVNNGTSDVQAHFNIAGLNAAQVTPWLTSATESLSNQVPVAVANGAFDYDLPAMSVITFAGEDPSAAPGLAVHWSGEAATLQISGPAGMHYTLFSSTNLSTWQAVWTTNPPTMPVSWTDTSAATTAKFYSVQYGP